MKCNYFLFFSLFLGASVIAQQKDSLSQKQKAPDTEENRNVMLNASSNTGPREVNIGLPSSVGGITVLENDLPVVYHFWPELPSRTWRPSQSLDMAGLVSVSESTVTLGDFGYAVSSYTKTGSDRTQLVGTIKGNHHGYYLGDVNLSGRFGNSNWHYALGALVTGDPGEAKHKGSRLIDDTQLFRGVMTYRFDEKNEINLGYKYAHSKIIGHYAPFVYHTDGKVTEYKGIGIGTDSYMLSDGYVIFKNILTGEPYRANFEGSDSPLWSFSHTFDLWGKHDMGKDWLLKHSTRIRYAESSAPIPLLAGTVARGTDSYTYQDGTPYIGEYVQRMLAIFSPKTPTTTWMTRLWAEKRTATHQWRFGVFGQYYKEDHYHQDRTFLFHSVEKQPRMLYKNGTTDPFFDYNVGGEYHDGYETKITAYASDSWAVTPWLDLSYGANFRYQKMEGDYSLQPRVTTNTVLHQPFTTFNHDWYHLNGDLRTVIKLTPQFGLLGNFTYQEKHGYLEDYSGAYTPDFAKTKTPFLSGGIYYNNNWLSLVSQVSTLTRNNYQTRLSISDRHSNQNRVVSVHYDIKTIGWTTDMVLKPFNNFQLHYLITLQNPEYNNYSWVNPFNSQPISYDGNVVNGISKVLMEIDPSYSINKFRFGLNFRYFSKQYVSLTNQFFIEPRWESFFSSSYDINKHFNLGFNVVNIFNQTGASTSIANSEVPYANIQDAEGTLVTGSYIRPLTFEFQLNFKF